MSMVGIQSVLSDEMQRRCAEVHGQILPEEGLLLAELAAKVPSEQIIVEIGAYKGKSSCYLAAGAKAGGGALVYAVDLWDRAPWPEYADPEVCIAWAANVGNLGLVGRVVAVQADTEVAAREIDGEVGLLFVDSDHSYEGVCRDIGAWAPRVTPDGVMAFHDANTEHWGVAKAIRDRLLATARYTYQIKHGLAILRRRPP